MIVIYLYFFHLKLDWTQFMFVDFNESLSNLLSGIMCLATSLKQQWMFCKRLIMHSSWASFIFKFVIHVTLANLDFRDEIMPQRTVIQKVIFQNYGIWLCCSLLKYIRTYVIYIIEVFVFKWKWITYIFFHNIYAKE